MTNFLITRPEHDDTVAYLFHWSEEILEFAKVRNIKFSDFKREKANRIEVEKYLEDQNPRLVFFNGHGSYDLICGHKDEPLIISGENESLLSSRIVYAVSCAAAKDLGSKAVNKKCEAFIGYEGPFAFVRDPSRSATPQKDKFADPFKQSSNVIFTSLLEGHSAQESVEKAKRLTSELIRRYSTSDVEPGYKEIRFWLFWNISFLSVKGDSAARFMAIA